MPGFIAKKLCPELVFVGHHGEKYSATSKLFMKVIEEYDPEYESMGCDEANLDITRYLIEKGINNEEGKKEVAKEMRTKI